MCKYLKLLILFALSFQVMADEEKADLSDIEYLGSQIYLKDWLAWQGTDFLLNKNILQNDKNVKGWIVDVSVKPYAVHFMGSSEKGFKIFHTVLFSDEWKPSYSNNEKTMDYHQEMYQARTIALENLAITCTEKYNTVVLPAQNGWIVYALASTTEVGVIVMGGHNRIITNKEGTKALKVTALSKSCTNIAPPPEDKEAVAVAAFITHLLDPHPNEIHVYASKLHHTTIYVATSGNTIWKVENGKITKNRRMQANKRL